MAAYAVELSHRLAATAGPVVGTYLVGSSALGGYQVGASDIDLVAVLATAPTVLVRHGVVEAVSHPHLPCPARGLELQVYDASTVATARPDAAFVVNLNTGPAMATSVSFDPATEPAHWFVVDRAIAHRHGVTVTGPTASAVIAATPRAMVLDALAASTAWHADGDPLGFGSVLNACRALRFAADDTFVSKDDGAGWAIDQGIAPQLVRAARDGRRLGATQPLPADEVAALLARAAAVVRTR